MTPNSPVRIVSRRGAVRSAARRFAAAVEAAGAPVKVPWRARPRPGDWEFVGRQEFVEGQPDAVVTPTEETRDELELARPDLAGRVWVLAEGGEDELARLLVARQRPSIETDPVTIGIVGYNQKFIRPIADHLARIDGVTVMRAEWPKYAVIDEPATIEVLDAADVVVAEWCGPNAVYASRHKRRGQHLIVRLHRFELERDDWRQVDIGAVDQVVTVGPYYRNLVLEKTGWPDHKVTIIPNPVDIAQFDRPKLPGADATLGLLGATGWRKRPDRALDILDRVGDGWSLSVKGERPEDIRWMWEDAEQRAAYQALYARIERYGAGVDWEGASPLVAQWFRRVGVILSTSDDESFHLAPAEGMASGTRPVVWNWPGAAEIYERRHVVSTIDDATRLALEKVDPHEIRREVAHYELAGVLGRWRALLLDGAPAGPPR